MKNNMNSQKLKDKLKKMGFIFLLIANCAITVLAADPGEAEFNSIVLFICGWVVKFGIVSALFGAFQTVSGFRNDDADTKSKGLRFLMSGLMTVAIANEATVGTLFGITK